LAAENLHERKIVTTPQLITGALCLALLAIGLAACGDDDDDALSDEQYFAEADQLNGELDQTF
jgi:hypothetical protein